MLKVGCCGFARGMKEYFDHFRLVEVQQTFYRLPQAKTALRWRQSAPADFEFALKAWQLITHPPSSPTYRRAGVSIPREREGDYGFFRPTAAVLEAWQRTREVAQALRARVVVFQCPARFVESPDNVANMRRFFTLAGGRDFIFAWEPRGEWHEATVRALCQELDLVHCVDPFQRASLHGHPRYFRLHGGPGYRHRYTDEELAWLAGEVGQHDTYVLFNNLGMFEDALRFQALLETQN